MSTLQQKPQNLVTWKLKLELAAQGSFQAIQQLKEHILGTLNHQHPIFKQSFYDILQHGYQIHQLTKLGSMNNKTYDMFIDLPLTFLLSGKAQIRCINLEGDNEIVESIQDEGLVQVDRNRLTNKFGESNINILTGFEIVAKEPCILLQINGKNKLSSLTTEKKTEQQILDSKRQMAILNRFMIIPPKQAVKVRINDTNKNTIKDKLYLLSGKACFYLDNSDQFDTPIILACYTQGYINPTQFPITEVEQQKTSKTVKERPVLAKKKSGIQNSFSAIAKSTNKGSKNSPQIQQQKVSLNCIHNGEEQSKIKLMIFEESDVIYFESEFIREDYAKSIETKRKKHLIDIIKKYKSLPKEQIVKVQQKLINKFRLPRKIVDAVIYKIPQRINEEYQELSMSDKKGMQGRMSSTDKKITTKSQLRSTASSVKCNIRIRKSKKVVN